MEEEYYRPPNNHFVESNSSAYITASEKIFTCEELNNNGHEYKTEPEEVENEQSQDNNNNSLFTPSCVSKLDYALPKYRNNVSPAIDNLVRMMNMPSLITSEDLFNDLSIPTNCLSSPYYYCGDNENFAVPIPAKEHLDICFSTPKPFVSTYKRDSTKDHVQSKTKKFKQEPVLEGQESVDLPSDDKPILDSPGYEVKEMLPYILRSKKKVNNKIINMYRIISMYPRRTSY